MRKNIFLRVMAVLLALMVAVVMAPKQAEAVKYVTVTRSAAQTKSLSQCKRIYWTHNRVAFKKGTGRVFFPASKTKTYTITVWDTVSSWKNRRSQTSYVAFGLYNKAGKSLPSRKYTYKTGTKYIAKIKVNKGERLVITFEGHKNSSNAFVATAVRIQVS